MFLYAKHLIILFCVFKYVYVVLTTSVVKRIITKGCALVSPPVGMPLVWGHVSTPVNFFPLNSSRDSNVHYSI